jgi:asparagine synthase (glutamine-hydrolysing)
MCGIVGIVGFEGQQPVDPQVLLAMRDSLAYRGPDGAGMHVEGPRGFAHRRLSIIDLAGGHQPMIGGGGDVWLVYNGEIYNFRELRSELRSFGVEFQTQSDTEVLLAAYLRWGIDCVNRLVGMFAFAIWDGRSGTLHLGRDRLGVKPLLWTRIGGQIVFASEVAAFFQHPNFTPEANLDAISSYLTFRQAVGELTFYRGANKVLPGHTVSFTNGGIKDTAYWALKPGTSRADLSEADWYEGVTERLRKAVERRMVADVPVGAYLSGGLDSAIVVALMAKSSPNRLKTFSIGYPEAEGYDESRFARQVAAHCGTDHYHVVVNQAEYQELWQRLVEHRGVPLSIPHESALYHLSRVLREKVTVAMSGEGADELFGGYGRVQRSPMDWKKVAFAHALLGAGLSKFIGTRPSLRDTGFAQLACESHLQHFFHVYNWMPFEEKWGLMTEDALSSIDHDARTIGLFEKLFAATEGRDPYDRVLHVFERVHLECLLDRLDAMSMAASVEGRVPFVDHELVEFVTDMPFKFKMRWNSPLARGRAFFHTASEASEWLDTSKHLLRQVGASLLPHEIAYRKKLGFPTPLDKWMATGLRQMAHEVLLSPRALARGIFDPVKLRGFLERAQTLPFDFYGKKVWMLLNIEMWFQSAIDRRSVRPVNTSSAAAASAASCDGMARPAVFERL